MDTEPAQAPLSRREYVLFSSFSLLGSIVSGCSSSSRENREAIQIQVQALLIRRNILGIDTGPLNILKNEAADNLVYEVTAQVRYSYKVRIEQTQITMFGPTPDYFPKSEVLGDAFKALKEFKTITFARFPISSNFDPPPNSYFYFINSPSVNGTQIPFELWTNTFTTLRSSRGETHSIINLAANTELRIPSESFFWVEFAQAMDKRLGRIDLNSRLAHDRNPTLEIEIENNQWGIAMGAAQVGMSYKDYVEIANFTGSFLSGDAQLKPVNFGQYFQYRAIFAGRR